MSKKWLLSVMTMAMIFTLGISAGCAGSNSNATSSTDTSISDSSSVATGSITLSATSAKMDVYDTLQLTATTEDVEGEVEWSSSNADIATVDQNGLVTAHAAGSVTITASIGGVSATCEITATVSDVTPIMTVSTRNVQINKGDSFDVTVSTTWKGKEMENAVYSWYLEDANKTESAIASISISEDGRTATFTGLSQGTETYSVSTFVNGRAFVETIVIECKDNAITMEISNLTLGSQGYQARLSLAEAEGHITSIVPDVVVYYKGEVVENAHIDWIEQNLDIAAMDENGKISGLKPGVANFQALFAMDGKVAVLNVQVEVYILEYEYSIETPVELDLNGTANATLSIESVADQLKGTAASAVIGESTFASVAYENGILTLDKASIGNVYGNATITAVFNVMNGDIVACVEKVNIPVTLYRTISTAEEFLNIPSHVLVEGGVTLGDFRVTADIDLQGATIKGVGAYTNSWTNPWTGTFEGNGHTISNGVWNTTNSGLFSSIANGGVVQNINFVNLEHRNANSGFICSKLGKEGLIKNVLVHGKFTENVGAHWTPPAMFAAYINGGVIENCFAIIESSSLTDYGSAVAGYNDKATFPMGTVTNTVVIDLSGTQLRAVGTKNVKIAEQTESADETVKVYNSFKAYAADSSNYEFDDWAESIIEQHIQSREGAALTISAEKAEVAINGQLQLYAAVAGYVESWSLKTPVAGVSIDAASGLVTASSEAQENAEVIVVTNGIFGGTAEYTIKVVKQTLLSSMESIDYDASASDMAQINVSHLSSKALTYRHALVNGVAVSGGKIENGVVMLPKAAFADGEKANEVVISVTDEEVIYEVSIPVVKIEKIIRTVEDLNWFAANSASSTGKYYVLGGNIDYTGTYKMVGTNWTKNILDGRGYAINNLVTSSGLIIKGAPGNSVAEVEGTVVKNLILTNAKAVDGCKSILISNGGYTIQDVYVSIAADSAVGTYAFINTQFAAVRLKGCIFEYLGESSTYLTTEVFNGCGILNGVYAVKVEQMDNSTRYDREESATNYIADVYGFYADWNAFAADDEADFSMFSEEFWDLTTYSVPVPKKLDVNVAIYNTENGVMVGGEYVVNASGYSNVTINDVAGVTFSGRTISVDKTAGGGVEITITATSVLTGDTAVKTITTKDNIVENAEKVDFDLRNATVLAKITDKNVVNASVTFGGNVIAGAKVENGVLTLPNTAFAQGQTDWGDLKVVVTGEVGMNLITINVPVHAFKSISTLAQLDAIETDAYRNGIKLYGLFELTADIDMEGQTWKGNTWYANGAWATEWDGVLDGKGHAIRNWTLSTGGKGENAGLFSKIGASGVVKNLAFINAAVDSTGLLATQCDGTVDNVLVTGSIVAANVNWAPASLLVAKHTGGIISNCMVVYNNVSDPASSYGGFLCGFTAGRVENNTVINLSGKKWYMISKPNNSALKVSEGTEHANGSNRLFTSWADYDDSSTNTLVDIYLSNVEDSIIISADVDFDLRNDLQLDLSQWEMANLTSVSINGAIVNLTAKGGKLTLAKDTFGQGEKDWGKQSLTLVGTTSAGTDVTVNVNLLAFKSIRNLDDIKNIPNECFKSGTHGYGYFKMTADIDMTGIAWSGLGQRTATDTSWSFYFRGTFDGDGHAIRNWTIADDVRGGLIAYSGGGAVIKNIAFINATVNGHGLVSSNSNATFENIFVSASIGSVAASKGWSPTSLIFGVMSADGAAIKDCFVICKSIATPATTHGALLVGNTDNKTHTITNNVVINLSGVDAVLVGTAKYMNVAVEQADLTKNQLCTSWDAYNGKTTNTLAAKYLAEVQNV